MKTGRDLAWLWGVMLVLGAILVGVVLNRPVERFVIQPALISSAGGQAYVAAVPATGRFFYRIPAGENHDVPSQFQLYEDGRPLGPANALHDAIRAAGAGAYSHWNDSVYFSAADGSDPRTNGRRYEIVSTSRLDLGLLSAVCCLMGGLFILSMFVEARGNLRCATRPSNWIAVACAAGIMAATFHDVVSASGGGPLFTSDSAGYFIGVRNIGPEDLVRSSNGPHEDHDQAKDGVEIGIRGWGYRAFSLIPQSLVADNSAFVPWQMLVLLLGFAALGMAIAFLTGSAVAGAVAAAFFTLNVGVTIYAVVVMPEALFVAFLVLHAAAALYAIKTGSLRALIAAGAFAGLAIILRPAGYSLLVGLFCLAFLTRASPWWKAASASILPAVVLVMVSAVPNLLLVGKLATHGVAGHALLSHVLPLARPGIKTSDPALYAQIVEQVERLDRSRSASYPYEYWQATTNQLNELYWLNVNRLIARKYPSDRNAVALSLAIDIIRGNPLGYLRHVGAHLYGAWVSLFAPYGTMASMSDFFRPQNLLLYDVSPDLQKNFKRPDAKAAESSSYLDPFLWSRISDQLRRLLPLYPIIAAVPPVLVLLQVMLGIRRDDLLQGAALCFIQVWLAFILVALSQDAIGRYSVVWEPLMTCGMVLFAIYLYGLSRKLLARSTTPLGAAPSA